MDPHVYNTLILSDLHLGAETSRAREATLVLKNCRFRRLILLGQCRNRRREDNQRRDR